MAKSRTGAKIDSNKGVCEILDPIQHIGQLPQGLAKSRTGAKIDPDEDDGFEIPECWKTEEKTRLCRFLAFIEPMFAGGTRTQHDAVVAPSGVRNKIEDGIEGDVEDGLNHREDLFGKTKISGDSSPGSTKIFMFFICQLMIIMIMMIHMYVY